MIALLISQPLATSVHGIETGRTRQLDAFNQHHTCLPRFHGSYLAILSQVDRLTRVSAARAEADPPPENLPSRLAAKIKTVDEMHRSIRINQSISQWQFDTVRSSYQAILKRAGSDPAVEEAVRVRLARVTRDEQAAAGRANDRGHPRREPSPRPGSRGGNAASGGGRPVSCAGFQCQGLRAGFDGNDRRPQALRLDRQRRVNDRLSRCPAGA